MLLPLLEKKIMSGKLAQMSTRIVALAIRVNERLFKKVSESKK